MPSRSSTPLADDAVRLEDDDAITTGNKKQLSRLESSTRKNIGILLLSVVIILWVSSSFLTYAIFSDKSYSKPYLVTYLNTSIFSVYLLPWVSREGFQWWRKERVKDRAVLSHGQYYPITQETEQEDDVDIRDEGEGKLGTVQTMRLSFEFVLMWFIANYFQSSCLKFTSVASATILSCTSSIFTLILSALLKIERFSMTKLFSVFLSLAGISLISSLDFGGNPNESSLDDNTKTPGEVLLGDGMALLGAFSYGVYTTLLKARIGHEGRISMQMFFGFAGVFNLFGLWPGLVLLHATGVESFELPPDNRVWSIVAMNASITLVSDYCWAYAMLLTTPLIVTVGLGLTIPLALFGQMLLQQKFPTGLYWVGAAFVLIAFLLISWESEALDSAIGNEEDDTDIGQTEG